MKRATVRRAACAAVIIMVCATTAAWAQEHVPAPYTDAEFPAWTRALWRAEAVLVGSFPFALFATLETYDAWRYVANGLNPAYAPWPFGSPGTVPYTSQETAWLAVSALSLSLVVSGIDFILGRINEQPHD